MDPVRRSAARTATFVAIPVAIGVVLISLLTYGGLGRSPTPPPATPAATSPVMMAAPPLTADAVPVCQSVVSNLPDTIAGLTRRPVSAGSEQNAAYGEPPITLACGTSEPTIERTATVYPLSGVCWYAEQRPDGTVWTTVDRTIPVTVTVPGAAEGSAQSVVGFSAAVAAGDPPRDAVPIGCH